MARLVESTSQAAEARKEMDWDQYFEERHPRREIDSIRGLRRIMSLLSRAILVARRSANTSWSNFNSNFSVSERDIAEELIWNLDERGYLVGVGAEDIAEQLEATLSS